MIKLNYFNEDQCIFVRDVYVKFYDIILKERSEFLSEIVVIAGNGVRITGTPGVGKSMFLHYCIKRQIEAQGEEISCHF